MLVEKKALAGKVGVFKLVTGEEIIARVVDDSSSTTVSVKNPLSMVMLPEENGQQGMVAFAPWVLGAVDDIALEINLSHVLVKTLARDDAASQYSQAIGETEVAQPKVAPLQPQTARRGGRGGR